ncbi:MAG: hypothetical protein ACQETT_10365, partial [Pseudomonadota bacterium]
GAGFGTADSAGTGRGKIDLSRFLDAVFFGSLANVQGKMLEVQKMILIIHLHVSEIRREKATTHGIS